MITRVLIDRPPTFPPRADARAIWDAGGDWPCRWIAPAGPLPEAFIFAARRRFTLTEPLATRIHVTADERYELFVDGEPAGRGPEIGERTHWFYDSYDLRLEPGEHVIVARVWGFGPKLGRWAMGSVRPGFLLCPEDPAAIDLLGTGVAAWEAKVLPGYAFHASSPMVGSALGVGAAMEIDGRLVDWDAPRGDGDGWQPAKPLHEGNSGFFLYAHKPIHQLHPAILPPQMAEPFATGLRNWPTTVPGHMKLRWVGEIADYCCFYPQLTVSGGTNARVELRFAETLFNGRAKARHADPQTADFRGYGDVFHLDGRTRTYEPLWWRCGRFIELTIETAAEPLTLQSLRLIETRYPFEPPAHFRSSDATLQPIVQICRRSLQMCLHETFVDCPYYEQLMYVGDTRIQALTHYTLAADDRLARKALVMFDVSRANATGLTTSNAPASAGQIIPPFSLWWICMIHDFALWRGDPPFVATLLPGARAVLDRFLARFDREVGLCRSLPGWNYVDTAWPQGVPTDGHDGFSGPINLQLVLALQALAELESAGGEPELAARWTRWAGQLSAALVRHFWDDQRAVMWDDLAHTTASQHSIALAILAGVLSPEQAARAAESMATDRSLLQARPYFLHYVFDAFTRVGRIDRVFAGLQPWRNFVAQGLRTTPEHFEDGRSDCHGWSAHPAYHVVASVLGVRPAGFSCSRVIIRPQLGELTEAAGQLAHPKGILHVQLQQRAGQLTGQIDLPDGVTGVFQHADDHRELRSGINVLT
jgi:hypothetical protein